MEDKPKKINNPNESGAMFNFRKIYPHLSNEEITFLQQVANKGSSFDEVNRLFKQKFGKNLLV